MPSTPLMASSSGVATVSAITFGLAPGYCACTTTEGGTTSGYSAIGSTRSAMRPPSSTSTERTPAKIGRSMKKRERFMAFSVRCGAGRGGRGLFGRGREEHARTHALHAIHDDELVGLEARGHDALAVNGGAKRDLAVLGLL